ncbi:MAG: UvrD-helicase domain-containing protein, partial [Firmicutes bacterium]|nr:UvrD-helicase domain-containing protein [Candidatus Caballimonas caccae]
MTEEQIREEAVNFDGGNILISASAGSGKTTLMIRRLCRLIASGKASVDNVLALTFTDASAIDMKDKLRVALSKIINEGHSELSIQLNLISNSDITTIDAFCSRLLRKYFFNVGINNDYKIIEPVVAEEYKKIALTNVFNSSYEEGGEFLEYIDKFAYKRNDNKLREIVLKFYNAISTETDFDSAIEKYESLTFNEILDIFTDYLVKNFLEFKNKFILLKQEFTEKKYETGLNIVNIILGIIDDFIEKKDAYILSLIKLPSMPSKKKNEEELFLSEKESLSSLKDKFSKFIADNKVYVLD